MRSTRFATPLALTALSAFTAATAYEWLKQLLFPGISIWQSHAVTILFTTVVATTVAYFVLRASATLHRRLHERAADQRRAEAALQHLAAIVECSEDAIVGGTPDGVILSWNRAAERLYGYPAAEAVGRPISLIYPPEHPDEGARIAARLKAGEAVQHDDAVRMRKDGTRVPVSVTISPITDAAGSVVGVSAIARDITERKRLEAALRESESQTRALLDVAHDITGALDFDALIDRVQRRTAELLPCDLVVTFALDPAQDLVQVLSAYGVPAELFGPLRALRFTGLEPFDGRLRRGETVVINDMAAQTWLSAELVAQFGITALIAVPVQMRARFFGSLVACSVSGRRFESRQVELLMGIAHQLAVANDAVEQYDRQKHEAEVSSALARVGQQLMAALGTAAFLDRLCQVTADVLRGSASHTLLRHADEDVYVPVASYGATPEAQAIARAIKIPRQMMDGVLAELEHADVSEVRTIPLDLLSSAEQKRLGLGITLCMALRRGPTLIGLQVVQARNRTEPFRPIDLRIARGIAQIASVALEHARVVEELNQASRLKSEFVATMSHELRTPINIILGYADLLLGGEFGPLTPDQTAALRQTNRSAGELLELINATLDLGRFEAGQVPLAVQEVDLTDLLGEVRAETRRLGGTQTCRVLWPAVPDLPPLSTDFVKLKTVLKNLVNNAVKFTEQGSVTVSVEPADDGVMFSVADTGIGIAPEVLPIIFEPFRQADSSTTRRYGGVGLGLYIVRRFVALLGGSVTVDSTLGQGSTFRVWVPFRTPASRVAA